MHLLGGGLLWFGIRVELRTDPVYQRPVVEPAVRDALDARLAPAVRAFTAPVTAARVLVWARMVPGVIACTMPRLLPLPGHAPAASPRRGAGRAGAVGGVQHPGPQQSTRGPAPRPGLALHLDRDWPWTRHLAEAFARLRAAPWPA
jgi:hypothetical protein